jgi:hypothetical protein
MWDLSIPIDKDIQEILTIASIFRFIECCMLPMGIKPARDIFQSGMV